MGEEQKRPKGIKGGFFHIVKECLRVIIMTNASDAIWGIIAGGVIGALVWKYILPAMGLQYDLITVVLVAAILGLILQMFSETSGRIRRSVRRR